VITEWFLSLAEGVINWFVTIIPPLPAVAVDDASTSLGELGSLVGSMSVWVNWIGVGAQVSVVMTLYFTFLAVKILRALFAHVPFFGGNG
jgi:hypothetical protein